MKKKGKKKSLKKGSSVENYFKWLTYQYLYNARHVSWTKS